MREERGIIFAAATTFIESIACAAKMRRKTAIIVEVATPTCMSYVQIAAN